MWKKIALCAVPIQVAALALLYAGIGSAQVPDPPDLGVVDLPSLSPPPETLTLSGTIRDFKASHPDFEDALGDDRGITTSTIGPDRKPVYASATTHTDHIWESEFRPAPSPTRAGRRSTSPVMTMCGCTSTTRG